MSQIIFEGSPELQTKLKALVREFIDVFATKVRKEPAVVEPMKIVKISGDFHVIVHRLASIRKRSIRKLELGVKSKPTPKGQSQKRRFTLDFVRLNSTTGGLEGWLISNI